MHNTAFWPSLLQPAVRREDPGTVYRARITQQARLTQWIIILPSACGVWSEGPTQSPTCWTRRLIGEGIRHVAFCLSCPRPSAGAVWKSRWSSWAPVPDKPTVSVDVKQHFNQSCLRWKVVVPNTCFGAYTRKDWRHGRLYMTLPIAYSDGVSTTGRRWYRYNVSQFLNKADSVQKYTTWHNVFAGLGVGWRVQMPTQDRPSHTGVKIQGCFTN